MKAKLPFVVKITDPEKLKNALNENKPLNTKMKIVSRCKIEEVSYTKGEAVEIDRGYGIQVAERNPEEILFE